MSAPRKPPPRPARSAWLVVATALCVVACAFVLGAAGHLAWQRYGDDVHEVRAALKTPKLPDLQHSLSRALERGPSKLVYLNREGAALTGGDDDAKHNRSSIVSSAGLASAQVPAFVGTAARWNQIVACVKSKFEPYDVRVVDQRPVEGSYVMAVVGGTPKLLGDQLPVATQRVTGLAPFSGDPIRDAVVMVFSREMKENLRTVCETASMEIAHAFGLDHSRNCKDLMTYMRPCGSKAFMDADIACGEEEDRPCKGGALSQNSHARLLALLGPRPPEPPPAAPSKVAKTSKNKISAAPLHVADDGHFHQH